MTPSNIKSHVTCGIKVCLLPTVQEIIQRNDLIASNDYNFINKSYLNQHVFN